MMRVPSAKASSATWLKIGRIGKAHGLRGDFFVSGRDAPIPKQYGQIYIGETVETAKCTVIEKSGWVSERPVIKCSLAQDRTSADALTGLSIWVDSASVSVNDSSEYLWSDLEGRQVNSVDGTVMGRVRSVYNAGAGDVIEIEDSNRRLLGVPMISNYVDMSFVRGGSELSLAVPCDVFDDLWQEPKKEDAKITGTKPTSSKLATPKA
jgi:16S rRNA processing protein RimM